MAATMKYVGLSAPGPAANMHIAEGPRPQARAGEVLVRVRAAGVNRPDIVQRLGHYPPPPGASDILGLEIAGEIVALGEGPRVEVGAEAGGETNLSGWQVGDPVCALVAGGGYAEYVAVPAPQLLPIPAGMDFIHAAAIPETYFTVWTNVFQSGGLKAGESLLVHGGSSGIGTTAIALAHALGSTVYATVRSAEKAASCRAIGAVEAIDYTKEDFADAILSLTGGRGVDVILDMRAGPFFAGNIKAAAMGGRIVHIAALAGRKVTLDILTLMQKRLTLTGSTLRARSIAEKGLIAEELQRFVWPLFEAGTIAPEIFRVLPLKDVVVAHELVESNNVIGKVVLEV